MRPAIFIVLVLFVFKCFGEAKKTGKVKAVIGLYCPIKTNWNWEIDITNLKPERLAYRNGNAAEEFQFVEMVSDDFVLPDGKLPMYYTVVHKCSSDGSKQYDGVSILGSFSTDKTSYIFIAFDLKSMDQNEGVYEKLFVQYLKNECSTGDCSTVKQQILCSQIVIPNQAEKCKNGLEKAYTFYMDNRDSNPTTTTQKSNKTTFIIIGAAVGVVLLIAGFVACFFCKRKKKNGPDASGMTSGTTTKTKTMTKSGTTKQTTATGTFPKTDQTGTNVTGMQRY